MIGKSIYNYFMAKKLRLTRKDYETVLKYYKLPFKQSEKASSIKVRAEKVLADKLCRCIKRVTKKSRSTNEQRSIAICKKSVLQKKGLTDVGFKCRKSTTISLRKTGGSHKSKNNRTIRKTKR